MFLCNWYDNKLTWAYFPVTGWYVLKGLRSVKRICSWKSTHQLFSVYGAILRAIVVHTVVRFKSANENRPISIQPITGHCATPNAGLAEFFRPGNENGWNTRGAARRERPSLPPAASNCRWRVSGFQACSVWAAIWHRANNAADDEHTVWRHMHHLTLWFHQAAWKISLTSMFTPGISLNIVLTWLPYSKIIRMFFFVNVFWILFLFLSILHTVWRHKHHSILWFHHAAWKISLTSMFTPEHSAKHSPNLINVS